MVEFDTRNRRSLACSRLAGSRLAAGMAYAMIAAIAVLAMEKQACAQSAGAAYPKMAAVDRYLMTEQEEVALARSAAPESVSKDAEVWVLDRHGYQTAVKGHNGFVCAVQRSWTAPVDDPEFWNPKLRAPTCFNAPATRSFVPRIVKRTTLALAGKTKEQLAGEMKAAFERKEIPAIEPGAMAYMLSKQGYLNDRAGHWHPHVMIFMPQEEPAGWGANLPSSPIFAATDQTDRATTFFIPVAKWSDGSADAGDPMSH
jgi:hypothetical protein